MSSPSNLPRSPHGVENTPRAFGYVEDDEKLHVLCRAQTLGF